MIWNHNSFVNFSLALKSAILLNCSRSWFLWPSSRASIQVGLVFLLRRRFGSNFTHTMACFFFSELALDFLQSLIFSAAAAATMLSVRTMTREWKSLAKMLPSRLHGKIKQPIRERKDFLRGSKHALACSRPTAIVWHLQAKIVNFF